MTDAELDAVLIAASLELSAAIRTRPRDQTRIDKARTRVQQLQAIKDARNAPV
jgi:hypothetical protein